MLRSLVFLLATLIAARSAVAGAPPSGEVVRWNRVATDTAAALGLEARREAGVLAIVHLAIDGALRATPHAALLDAAVIAAAHEALVSLMPTARASFDAVRSDALDAFDDGVSKANGIAAGHEAAAAALRRPVDAAPRAHLRAAPHPGHGHGELTAQQQAIAAFWAEKPTQIWNRIAREVVATLGLAARDAARLLALVNEAMAGGDAVAEVMAQFFGTDLVGFTVTSGYPSPGITRSFSSFSQAARERAEASGLARNTRQH